MVARTLSSAIIVAAAVEAASESVSSHRVAVVAHRLDHVAKRHDGGDIGHRLDLSIVPVTRNKYAARAAHRINHAPDLSAHPSSRAAAGTGIASCGGAHVVERAPALRIGASVNVTDQHDRSASAP